MGFFRRHRTTLASGTVLVLAAASLVAYALTSTGNPVRQVDLNDGGVWVTSDRDGLFGRLNKPVGSLDAAFNPPGGAQQNYQLDVVQDAAAVVARDRAGGKLYPVDVARSVTVQDRGLALPSGGQVALAGGTLAVLDPAAGKVWALRVDLHAGVSALDQLSQETPPLATLDAADTAALAVGLDGVVHAASANGRTVKVVPAESGFGEPEYGKLANSPKAPRITAVGGETVVLDAESGTLFLPGGRTAQAGRESVLQQAGPEAATVVVASHTGMKAFQLNDDGAETLSEGVDGAPAEPVRLGECVHGAWAGASGGYFRSCDGKKASAGNLRDAKALVQPVFRVNRRAIVLNDVATGAVWDLSSQRKVDDWQSVKPPPEQNSSDKDKNENTTESAKDKPPKATDDTLGARPGRTTVLHVLDNDSDPAGNILSVTAVSDLDRKDVGLAIAPDGQTVEVTLPEQAQDAHFKYTVDDGKGLNATAAVTVQVRTESQNEPPAVRKGAEPHEWSVASGGRLTLPVLADWRDFDGDPVVLTEAVAKAGVATTTNTGFVEYAAPVEAGDQPIDYEVTDGVADAVAGAERVKVLDPAAPAALPPVARPDVARGQVGAPVLIRPLENDLPGADPVDPAAELRLAADVAPIAGASITTDTKTGLVTLTATKPGTYPLDYTAAFGNAPFAKGAIRVDVAAAPASPLPPVAMPDNAVVRGQEPVVTDVLANDFSPAGSVLGVQHAESVAGQLEVAVVKGRWLRINATAPALARNPQVVRYTVTDGVTGPITGEVTVTQLPPPADDTPVPKDDRAAARAGDSTTIPVLDNDISPAGAPLSLQSNVQGAPGNGRLAVTTRDGRQDVGSAYVSGDVVRYVAPDKTDAPFVADISYVAQNPDGDQAVGHAHVTVNPAPTPANPNQPPAPEPVEVRVVAGDRVTITVPSSGADPDGDSVAVTGIASAPALGRVVGIASTTLTYEAFPTSNGTDTFGFVVTDSYGRTGESLVRVAVVPPGDPQPPVAVDDVVTAAPGARLAVNVLSNDVQAPGDTVTVEPLGPRNPSLPGDVKAMDGRIELTAPDLTGKPLVITYGITNGLGQPSIATLTVRSRDDYAIPPVAGELFPVVKKEDSTVEVDLAGAIADPDGSADGLEVTKVFHDQAKVSGRKATVPVGDHPRTLVYEVKDSSGATAAGLIHVPSKGTGAPRAVPDKLITVPADGSVSVQIKDYVDVPSGKQAKLTTTDKVTAAPVTGLEARNEGDTGLVLTARGGYTGPAAVTFQVTDGTSLTDPEGRFALITVPVQVGPDTPVLRCPASALTVVEGGLPVKVDVTSVCHMWVADRSKLGDVRYTATWLDQVDGVSLEGSGERVLTVTAAGGAKPGSTGTIEVGAGDGPKGKLAVKVAAAPPPTVSPVTLDGVKAGDTATVDLVSYVRSQLRDPKVSVVSVTQAGGAAASATNSGSSVSITPNGEAHGAIDFNVVVTDVADTSRDDRKVTGRIRLNVLGVPDAPGVPVPGRTVLSKVVELSWSSPSGNGAPIDSYEVEYNGGKQTCAASPCTITGLSNGTEYRFTVRAHNLVGWGKASGSSAGAQPNTVPGAVSGLTTSTPRDGSLQLNWTAAPNEGTPVLRHEISWSGGGRTTAPGGATTVTASGLDNNAQTVFTVIAVNSQGPGPAVTVQGQSAGAPQAPAAPTFTATNAANAQTRAVTVSWGAVGANGPGPTTYTLTRTGGGTKTVCTKVTATTCLDDGLQNDGTIYSYTVVAANAAAESEPAGHTSPASAPAQMEATATPDPITGFTATPTGSDGQATLRFDAPASHGKSNTVTCTWSGGSCGTWTYPTGGQAGATQTVNGLPNGQPVTISLQTCNGSGGGAYAGNPCNSAVSAGVTTYGPMRDLVLNTSTSNTVVNFSVSVNPNGKPATVQVTTSRGFNQSFTTGVGGWSWSGSQDVGYSAPTTVTVTVSDAGRPTLSQSQQQTTPPPPPPPSVTVSKGAACPASGCNGTGVCTSNACAYIVVRTANFSGNVTCTFDSDHGPVGFVNENFGPNETRQTRNYYGYPREQVYVTCGGVRGSMVW
ncbi:Ig-like domain-containing protein [Lentzea sp. HUAS12]|uniref:Ig-like domain-containing protein n=1 Tax=Lentzea sp. HUAS12 TaxID=2951806 RepID=UPI0020A0BEF4|nr:Ig-like domain-containing protein [Lentzea sp. HUAS12]USX52265.1 Ig-like domain-containing protein [Lentzea sp. HUAS12]